MANGIALKGDWRKLRPMANKLQQMPQEYEDDVMPLLVKETEDALKVAIDCNLPPPNADSTVKRKGFNRTLVETGNFPNAITHTEASYKDYKSRARKAYLVTADENIHHARTNTSYKDILGIVDQGGGRVPARHLLAQSFDLVDDKLKAIAIKRFKGILD